MSNIPTTPQSKLYRLWSVPLFIIGLPRLFTGFTDNAPHHVLLGAGMLLIGIFALRHNILDLSPKALDPDNYGAVSKVLMFAGTLLVLAAAAVALAS